MNKLNKVLVAVLLLGVMGAAQAGCRTKSCKPKCETACETKCHMKICKKASPQKCAPKEKKCPKVDKTCVVHKECCQDTEIVLVPVERVVTFERDCETIRECVEKECCKDGCWRRVSASDAVASVPAETYENDCDAKSACN